MNLNGQVLVIDDEVEVGHFFKHLLNRLGLKVELAHTGKEARQQFLAATYHIVLIDLKLPDASGLELLAELKAAQPFCEAIVMTGYSTTKTAVKAIQYGAYDYIEKPFEDISEIEQLIEQAFQSASQRINYPEEQPSWAKIAEETGIVVGKSQTMQNLMSVAAKIASKNLNVLIQGETGTGKELMARFIHKMSPRQKENFVAINCGALPENILESELFGHEKGAFTSAVNQRKGFFELADNGTLFLDEIGETLLSIQVKLLRVLETGEFLRVGGERPIRTDVRLIAATHVNLEKAVREKLFREDLYYRLDVARLELPSLRDRKEDIPRIVEHILNSKSQTENVPLQLSPSALQLLQEYHWPGNIRELVHVIEQAKAFTEGLVILPDHLPEKLRKKKEFIWEQNAEMETGKYSQSFTERAQEIFTLLESFEKTAEPDILIKAYRLSRQLPSQLLQKIKDVNQTEGGPLFFDGKPPDLCEVEIQAIGDTLHFYNHNIADAARSLGIGRNTLYRKIKEYHIDH